MELQRLGHPISFTALRMKVVDICETRENPFTDGIPSRRWIALVEEEASTTVSVSSTRFGDE
jgi:hypothetical protein